MERNNGRTERFLGGLGNTHQSEVHVAGPGGTLYGASVTTRINADKDPNLLSQLIDGTLNRVTLPDGETERRVDVPVLVHFPKRNLLLWVFSQANQHELLASLEAYFQALARETKQPIPPYALTPRTIVGAEGIPGLLGDLDEAAAADSHRQKMAGELERLERLQKQLEKREDELKQLETSLSGEKSQIHSRQSEVMIANQKKESELLEREAELKRKQAELDSARSAQHDEIRAERDALRQQTEDAERELAEKRKQIEALSKKTESESQQKLADLSAREQDSRVALSEEKEAFEKLRAEQLAAIEEQRQRERTALAESRSTAEKELDESRARVASERDALAAERREIELTKADLEEQRSKLKLVVEKLDTLKQALDSRSHSLDERQRAASQQAAALEERERQLQERERVIETYQSLASVSKGSSSAEQPKASPRDLATPPVKSVPFVESDTANDAKLDDDNASATLDEELAELLAAPMDPPLAKRSAPETTTETSEPKAALRATETGEKEAQAAAKSRATEAPGAKANELAAPTTSEGPPATSDPLRLEEELVGLDDGWDVAPSDAAGPPEATPAASENDSDDDDVEPNRDVTEVISFEELDEMELEEEEASIQIVEIVHDDDELARHEAGTQPNAAELVPPAAPEGVVDASPSDVASLLEQAEVEASRGEAEVATASTEATHAAASAATASEATPKGEADDDTGTAPPAKSQSAVAASSAAEGVRQFESGSFRVELALKEQLFRLHFHGKTSLRLSEPRAVIQAHSTPTYGLVTIGVRDDQLSFDLPLDVENGADAAFLRSLAQRFRFEVELVSNHDKALQRERLSAPLEENARLALDDASGYTRNLNSSTRDFAAAVESWKKDPERDGKLAHPFHGEAFKDPSANNADSPASVKTALGVLDFWSEPENFRYLTLKKSHPLSQFNRLLRRFLERAFHFGLSLPERLKEKAVSFELATSPKEIVHGSLANFAEVCLNIRTNDLTEEEIWDNWQALLQDCDEHQVAPDPQIEQLAKKSLRDFQRKSQNQGHESDAIELADNVEAEVYEDFSQLSAKELLDFLRYPEHRKDAAIALARLRDASHLTELTSVCELMDHDEIVSLFPEFAGYGAKAEDAMLRLLSSRNPIISQAAAMVLGEIKSQKAIGPLLNELGSARNNQYFAFAWALGKLGIEIRKPAAKAMKSKTIASRRMVDTLAFMIRLHGEAAAEKTGNYRQLREFYADAIDEHRKERFNSGATFAEQVSRLVHARGTVTEDLRDRDDDGSGRQGPNIFNVLEEL
ncbi:MAG: hypothetical protein KC609_19605 [Myxococcales bacterium]|nr:hypothetical protein [Myxococcales bacterium]